jgi:hypothetical protein
VKSIRGWLDEIQIWKRVIYVEMLEYCAYRLLPHPAVGMAMGTVVPFGNLQPKPVP